jgi:hypothetical protein
VTGNTSDQRLRDTPGASAANHTRSVGSYRTRPGPQAQHRVLMPHQHLGHCRPVAAA